MYIILFVNRQYTPMPKTKTPSVFNKPHSFAHPTATAINPMTKAKVKVAASKRPVLKFGKAFKEQL